MTPARSDSPAGSHLMLHIETMGRKAGSAILSIGAVKFDPTGHQSIHQNPDNQLYVVINNLDSSNYGLASDPDTVRWWKRQPIWPELSTAIMHSDVTVSRATRLFTDFVAKTHPDKVWGNSPTFDIDLLRHLFEVVQQPFPLAYRREMDYRTVMDLVYPDRAQRPARPDGLNHFPPHHALGEALVQTHHLLSALRRMNLDLAALATPTSDPPVADEFPAVGRRRMRP